jgi:hypothetical protein
LRDASQTYPVSILKTSDIFLSYDIAFQSRFNCPQEASMKTAVCGVPQRV